MFVGLEAVHDEPAPGRQLIGDNGPDFRLTARAVLDEGEPGRLFACDCDGRHPSQSEADVDCCTWRCRGDGAVDVMRYSDTRAHLKEVMDRVVADRMPVVVTRPKGEAVPMVSLSDGNAIGETLHLLSTASDAARLRHAIRELEEGAGTVRELVEP